VNVQGIASIDQNALIRKIGEQLSAAKDAIRVAI
jgi:hypothetical protein